MTRIGTIQTLQFPPIGDGRWTKPPLHRTADRVLSVPAARGADARPRLRHQVGSVSIPWTRCPLASVNFSCAPGCGGSRSVVPARGPVRPRGEVQSLDVSDLRDLLALSVLPVLAERWTPSVLGQLQDRSRTLVNRSNPTRNPMFASCAAWHRADAAPANRSASRSRCRDRRRPGPVARAPWREHRSAPGLNE